MNVRHLPSHPSITSRLAVLLCAAALLGAGCATSNVAYFPLDAPPPEPLPQALQFPAQSSRTLTNGLEVVVIPMPGSGTVSARLGVPGGGAAEPAEATGLAEFAWNAMRYGAGDLDADGIAARLDGMGSELSLSCGADACDADLDALARNLEPSLALLGLMLRSPTFPAEQLERGRGQWAAFVAYMETQPGHAARRLTRTLLYGDHAYGRYAPTRETLAAFDGAAVTRFHREHTGPRGAHLVVAGDVAPETVFAVAERTLGAWSGPAEAPAPVAAPEPSTPGAVIHLVDRPGAVQATLLVAHAGPRRTDPDYLAARLADEVLGGGASRRLFLDLRERRGLTYGAGSYLNAMQAAGHAAASANVRTEKAAEALAALLGHLDAIGAADVPAAELGDAASYLAGTLAMRLDNPGTVASLVLRQRMLSLPEDEWSAWPRRIRTLRAGEVREAAQRLWSRDGRVIVVVGDAAALRPTLEKIQAVQEHPAAK